MKRIVIRILAGLGIVLALFLLVGLFLPSGYEVERSLSMDAKPAVIFNLVNNLRENEKWSPWQAADPSLKTTYGGPEAGQGAWATWQGDESGEGKMTIVESQSPARIVIDLDFKEQGQAQAYWRFREKGQSTEVTWGMQGDSGWNIIGRYFGLCIDGMVGSYYEDGLQRLKKVAEAADQG